MFAGTSSLLLTINSVNLMWSKKCMGLYISMIILLIVISQWWRDTIRESLWMGLHSIQTQQGLKVGSILFIASEVMFFLSFFWAFFHSSLSPSIQINLMWPPKGILPFDIMGVPLLNTIILVSSGVTLTWTHMAMINGNWLTSTSTLITTILLGSMFSISQGYEYFQAPFTISDSSYGTTFFVTTGFHGLHVLIGASFLLICLSRYLKGHYGTTHHVGLELASWYWHFVDIVWLSLYICFYWWGS